MPLFTTSRAESVAILGEVELLGHIRRWLGDVAPRPPYGMGDDCAVLPPSPRPQLVTTDPVIYGQHFDDRATARQVGAKLLKRNLSDIAAMGGRPRAAVVSLAMGGNTHLPWLRGFYHGLAAEARRHRVKIVGGDITQAAPGFFGAFLTLQGEATTGRVLTRHGAICGDRLYVTGTFGGSLLGRHLSFQPRLAEAAWLARRPEVCAMLDVSDGLAKDLHAITPRGLTPALCPDAIPVSTAARRSARLTRQTPLFHALCDGEDYELLIVVCVKADKAALERAWRRSFPRVRLSLIGCFAPRGALPPGSLDLTAYHGYEHLR